MECFTAYHVVTDRPMEPGQVIRFDETHPSGVRRRVMEKAGAAGEILAHPERYSAQSLEHHTRVALRELALEEVRRERFPGYPSRLACLYLSGGLEEAERWAELFVRWGRPTYHIVRLRVRGSRFTGDANNCFDGSADQEENLRLALRYWRNEPNPRGKEPIPEILADGWIQVEAVVREIYQNIPPGRA